MAGRADLYNEALSVWIAPNGQACKADYGEIKNAP